MSAEIDLTETSNAISDAIRILKELKHHDTDDKVCGEAIPALDDAADHLEDVITALADGRLAEVAP